MNCSDIKKLLWDYIDESISQKNKKLIEQHLKTCKNCAQEYKLLAKYKIKMFSTKKVKAPSDFLAKVHSRIEQPKTIEKLIKRLFIPFKIKIPLELAGAVITIVFLIWIIGPQQRMQDIAKDEKIALPVISEKKLAVKTPDSLKAGKKPKDKITARSIRKYEDKEVPAELEKAESIKDAGDKSMDFRKVDRDEDIMELVIVVTDESRILSMSAVEGKSIKKSRKLDDTPDAEDKKSIEVNKTGTMKKKEKKAPVTQIAQFNQMLIQVTNIARRLKGRVIKQEYDKEHIQFQSVVIEVPVKNYNIFLKELKNLGELQKAATPSRLLKRKWIQNRIQFQQAE